jgi:hypothetical protein
MMTTTTTKTMTLMLPRHAHTPSAKSGLMWLDANTFKKHENVIAPEFAHLLGDMTGPKKISAEKST